MTYTEQRKQKMARYREIRDELKKAHPNRNNAWLHHQARVKTDMEFAKG